MSTPALVADFYARIWNAGDLESASEIVAEDFHFRGSLGSEMRGRGAFLDYVRAVRAPLSGYHCEILACVSEADQAFAKMRFSGIHIGPFRGQPGTGKLLAWHGAGLFRFHEGKITELWVLGDLQPKPETDPRP